MANASSGVYVARTTYATHYDGSMHIIHAGKTRVRAGHPIYVANPENFAPLESVVEYDVDVPEYEAATAEPNEKRGTQATQRPAPVARPAAKPAVPHKPAAKATH